MPALWKEDIKFVARNFRVGRMGEIDIIARDGDYFSALLK